MLCSLLQLLEIYKQTVLAVSASIILIDILQTERQQVYIAIIV